MNIQIPLFFQLGLPGMKHELEAKQWTKKREKQFLFEHVPAMTHKKAFLHLCSQGTNTLQLQTTCTLLGCEKQS